MDREIIVSLTSYPARIGTVHRVIESLMKQSVQADKILLWLSEEEFSGRDKALPQSLRNIVGLNGFEVRWVKENLKSHKKYFYVLQEYPQSIIITVDDDVFYNENMIKELTESYKKHPLSVSTRRARLMLRSGGGLEQYKNWPQELHQYVDKEQLDICAIGVGGILYPPGCANEDWFHKEDIIRLAQNQDDLWLKYNELAGGITVVYTGHPNEDILIDGTQSVALYKENLDQDRNDICVLGLSRLLKKEHHDIWQLCKNSLMGEADYWREKAAYWRAQGEIYANGLIPVEYQAYKIYICGAGKFAKILYTFLKQYDLGKKIEAFLVTNNESGETEFCSKPIQLIFGLQKQERFVVLCGVSEKNKREISPFLQAFAGCVWVDTDIRKIRRFLARLGIKEDATGV